MPHSETDRETPDGFHVEHHEDEYFASIGEEVFVVANPDGTGTIFVGFDRDTAVRSAVSNWENPFDWKAFEEGLERGE